ncbi:MAG: ISAs1 family transposase [Chloroflexi bacterium]|nr:MAG: ISAs1 family transposase [Chloroflexota bacterium]
MVGHVVAIDGKVMRRSQDCVAGRPAFDLVSAWTTDQQLVLGQLAVAPHSNEIPAVPALLALLDLRGAVVTLDAMHCQSSTARAIRSGAADFVLALKGNQPTTHAAVETFFAEAQREAWRGIVHQSLQTEDAGHDRVEQRRYWTTTDPALLGDLNPAGQVWPDLGCAGMVERCRTSEHGTSRETSYYLSSLPGAVADLAPSVHGH